MSEHTYKVASAKATATRIWNADFFHGSFNDLVDAKDPDSYVASVGLSEISGPDRKLSMMVTLLDHPWSQQVSEILMEDMLNSDPPLLEWSISYKNASWTLSMTWRD